ncbi:MAG TPA: S41 family peptidase [Bacteroidales bacterium]|nr:S41 family peptidase [Bacteroidales bacterium]
MIKHFLFPVFAFLLFVSIVFPLAAQESDIKKSADKLSRGLSIIDYFYVEEVDSDELVEVAFLEMLKELDPHSVYMDPKSVREANEPLEGKFEGVGIQFQIYKDTILVVSPVTGGPSEALGILAGDKIITIDGEEAFGPKVTNEWVRDHLRGDKGTQVTIEIYRKGQNKLLEYTITRDKIPIYSIDAAYMADPLTGYIKLNRFSRSTMEEYVVAMQSLQSQGMENLILDLRNNSGGFLDVSIALADEFLQAGKLIVYTEGRRTPRRDAAATTAGRFENGKLIVLINEGSASASEIVSGAVQDWDRGLVIGRRSFGKGLVQRPFWLPDSSQIRLTIARYYTPTGRCIQKPYDDGVESYFKDLYRRRNHGELMHPDSIHFPDSLKYTTPGGRIVYGGGGIMPDIFVPYDSTLYSDYYMNLWRKGTQNSFVTRYMETHRKKLESAYSSLDAFIRDFSIDDAFIHDFVEYAEEQGVKPDTDGLTQSKEIITTQIKALVARNLYGVSSYFQIVNTISEEYLLALEMMKNNEAFSSHNLNF